MFKYTYKSTKLIGILFLSIYSLAALYNNYHSVVASDISNSVIRLHVIANSDSFEDQALKLRVRDEIIHYLQDNMSSTSSIDDAQNFIVSHKDELTAIATNTSKSYGYIYPVETTFEPCTFPNKQYGDVTLPSGTYTALNVKIGKAAGHNWWCVLYPPLCFVDSVTGELADESKDTLRSSISCREYEYVTDSSSDGDTPVFRFKFLTFLNDIF